MANNGILALEFIISFCTLFLSTNGFSADSGWTSAHATFYGGADASGTMGKYPGTDSEFKYIAWTSRVIFHEYLCLF